MGEVKRKTYTAAFKAKVGLEAIRGVRTVNEIGQEYGVHPAQVGQWKREIQEQAETLFANKRGAKKADGPGDGAALQRDRAAEGRAGLAEKKVRSEPVSVRREWIEREAPERSQSLAVSRQCELAGVTRSWVYAPRNEEVFDELDLELLRLIDAEYTRRPFYGSRRMVISLAEQGHTVNRKRVQRLMRVLGLVGMAPGPATSRPHPEHKIYPYLLRGVADHAPQPGVEHRHHLHPPGARLRLSGGGDRLVLASGARLAALQHLGGGVLRGLSGGRPAPPRPPEIFNTDQGSQFTSEAFTGVLLAAGIAISMDGRGRALDNIFVERLWRSVKYEDIYLKGYASLPELLLGLTEYFAFYNGERPHQSLGYRTPAEVHRCGAGGGASIVDRFADRPDPAAPAAT
jgi:putative transposase